MDIDEAASSAAPSSKRNRSSKSQSVDRRTRPNILICGTPGTGKSTLVTSLLSQLSDVSVGYSAVSVGDIAKEQSCFEEWDEQRKCHVLDEDKLLDAIEDVMNEPSGGRVCDYHGCDLFPERWFDAVFVLRTDNTILYDRLTAREYPPEKVTENVQCEIFGTLAEEARDSYQEAIVFEFESNTVEDMEQNCEQILSWIRQWTAGVRCLDEEPT